MFLWWRMLLWRLLLTASPRPNWNSCLNSMLFFSTVVLYQICSCLMKWVLKMPVSYGWPFWYENMSFQTTESPVHVKKPHAFCCSFLVMACIMQLFLNRWTLVWYHVIGSHLRFLVLELTADAGMFLRNFHVLLHRTGWKKLLESSQNL